MRLVFVVVVIGVGRPRGPCTWWSVLSGRTFIRSAFFSVATLVATTEPKITKKWLTGTSTRIEVQLVAKLALKKLTFYSIVML